MPDKEILSQMIKNSALVQLQYEYDKPLRDYKSRFISIGHTSLAKKKTRITRNTVAHHTPETAMKIDWPNYLQFNQLAGLGA